MIILFVKEGDTNKERVILKITNLFYKLSKNYLQLKLTIHNHREFIIPNINSNYAFRQSIFEDKI